MEETRPGYYAIIPADVRYDQQIPANAKLLYGEISALIGKDGFCFASNAYFAEIYGVTEVSVARLITKLVDAGYLVRQMEKDASGKIIRRKLWLTVSVPQIQPLNNIDNTPQQNCKGGIYKNVKDTNTSITNIKDAPEKPSKPSLSDEQLRELSIKWITDIGASWPPNSKNLLFAAISGFYAPRATKRQTPSRTKAAFTALTNKLLKYSSGEAGPDPQVMVDLLDRATLSNWKSVFPSSGPRQPSEPEQMTHQEEQWL